MSKTAEDIENAAAAWLIQQDEPDWSSEQEAELEAWLSESAAYEAAYYRLGSSYRMADRLAALRAPQSVQAKPAFAHYWQPFAIAASLVVIILSGLLAFQTGIFQQGHTYETALGGQTSIPLADGTRIELNTDTKLRVDVSQGRRVVWLDRGEAYFEVKHNASHPFVVMAGNRRIIDLGTKFSVRRAGNNVEVNVAEGRVRLESAAVSGQSAKIIIGGQTALLAGTSELVTDASPERVANALSWRDGSLVFDQETLAEASAEFNRYNQKQLVLADSKIGSMTISGQFQATNVDAFARLLHRAYGIEIHDDGQKVTISE